MELLIRPFEDRDYARCAEIGAAVAPDSAVTEASLRHGDATIEPRIRQFRLVADVDGAGVLGWGRISHVWWAYHPRRFLLGLDVDPDWRRRGVGSALFDRLGDELRTWDPEVLRTEAPVGDQPTVAFLEHRGFGEWRRRWESVLDVASARVSTLQAAEERARQHGLSFSTYAAEYARRGDRLARDVYDLEMAIFPEERMLMDPGAEPMSFERFMAVEVDTPEALPEAHFLALAGDTIVGVSRLMRDLKHAHVIRQEFTGSHPRYRGQGIAQALKLRTVDYARANGYTEIRTTNDSTKASMLHINDKIGFQRQTATIIFERRFAL